MIKRHKQRYYWDGYVTEVFEDTFQGVLSDHYGKTPDLIATFKVSELRPRDRNMVHENAFFTWKFIRKQIGGFKVRLKFRRYPRWSKADLDFESPEVDEMNRWLESFNDKNTGEEGGFFNS